MLHFGEKIVSASGISSPKERQKHRQNDVCRQMFHDRWIVPQNIDRRELYGKVQQEEIDIGSQAFNARC